MTNSDKYCVTTPDGDCISTDPRCMHQPPKLPPQEQVNVPAIQRYRSNIANPKRQFRLKPPATQRWMCPDCDHQHTNCPIDMNTYRCSCGWAGNRNELLTEHGHA